MADEAEARDTARREAEPDLRRVLERVLEAIGDRGGYNLIVPQAIVDARAALAAPSQPSAPQALDVERLTDALEALSKAQRSPSKYRADFEQDARFILSRLPSEEEERHPYNGGICCDKPLADHAYASVEWVAAQDWYGPVSRLPSEED